MLVDPGAFSLDDAFTARDLDAVVVTHQHPDHLHPDRARELVEANPQALFVADPETGRKFLEAAIEETTALVREIRALPILSRKDHH